jgi:hypothetical protein
MATTRRRGGIHHPGPTYYTVPATPTAAGQRIRIVGHGGAITQWMSAATGTVTRFTNRGNPVIALDPLPGWNTPATVTDRYGCARLIDDDGNLVKTTVLA